MNPQSRGAGLRERFQWGSYGFLPGLLIGVVLGWIFSGVVSWVVRFGLALLILIPLVLLFFAWRWWTTRGIGSQVIMYEYPPRQAGDPIEARSRLVDPNSGYQER
ncbi:MAG: hypothetical protein H0V24_17475 [Chloroflexia bacterium]|nr:hypothetical protein [Chloroflexia bacterium]MDQ3411238.1 hypothetical protein [Chloroflexota bacterium]